MMQNLVILPRYSMDAEAKVWFSPSMNDSAEGDSLTMKERAWLPFFTTPVSSP
jgi:hypothetical protein